MKKRKFVKKYSIKRGGKARGELRDVSKGDKDGSPLKTRTDHKLIHSIAVSANRFYSSRREFSLREEPPRWLYIDNSCPEGRGKEGPKKKKGIEN